MLSPDETTSSQFLHSSLLSWLQQISSAIEGYVIPGVILIGVFGNTLSMIIFIKTRKRTDATIQYLTCLALTDTGVLLTLGLFTWVAYGLDDLTNGASFFHLATYSGVSCKMISFVVHTFECTSAWIIVAFTVERCYVVWFPLRRATLTPGKRLKIITGIITLAMTVSLPWLVLMDVYAVGEEKTCFYKLVHIRFTLWQFDTAILNYIPCCSIFILNVLIFIGVHEAGKSIDRKKYQQNSAKDGNLLISLLVVSTFYVIAMMPMSISFSYQLYLEVYGKGDENDLEFIFYLVAFFDEFSMMNYSFNFIIYGCTLPFYRLEVRKMFGLKK